MKALEDNRAFSASSTRLKTLVRKIEGYQQEIAEHRRKLEQTRDQLRDSYSRYSELYELAPVAFLALNKRGLSRDRSAAVFRVVQEALTNVMQHANGKAVDVDLKKENLELTISVSDNGQGIKDEAVNDVKALGIVGIRERIFRIGGEFNIHSIPGSGTRVEIVLGI